MKKQWKMFLLTLVFKNNFVFLRVFRCLLLLGSWFWKVGQLITPRQIAIYTSWRVMKTVTEQCCAATANARKEGHYGDSVNDCLKLYKGCSDLASVTCNLLWHERDGANFCFKWQGYIQHIEPHKCLIHCYVIFVHIGSIFL